MPDDVRSALERFQLFLGKHVDGGVIDEESGFTAANGQLLAAEFQMAHYQEPLDENPID